jgi:hypothetical protein
MLATHQEVVEFLHTVARYDQQPPSPKDATGWRRHLCDEAHVRWVSVRHGADMRIVFVSAREITIKVVKREK